MLKTLGLQIISWVFCLSVPWVAGSIIYFAAQERWLLVLASLLLSISMMLLGLEGVFRSTLDHLEQKQDWPRQRDLDP
ncbi:MAG: hypothetical protein CMH49_07225 [Myxococcales bacterium]|nr:hypothetical protein [Myxococcales bacterium]